MTNRLVTRCLASLTRGQRGVGRLIALSTAVCLGLSSCSPPPPENEQALAESTVPVRSAHQAAELRLTAEAVAEYGIRTAPVAKQVLVPRLVLPARVAFNAEAVAHVGSPLQGRVSDLRCRAGDMVQKGDVLLVVESPDLGEAQSDYLQKLSAAQAAGPAVGLAQSAYDRARALYDKSQGITLTEVQKREAEYRAAQAAQKSAQTAAEGAENRLHLFGMAQQAVDTLAKSTEVDPRFAITAPMAGQVIERDVTLGELVSPEKEALLVLADVTALWVLADVPEARLGEIAVGSPCTVSLGASAGPEIAGVATYVSPSINLTTRTAQVRVEVKDGHVALRPGMFARVTIETGVVANGSTPVLVVPDEAVQTVDGKPSVFVPVEAADNTFAARPVSVGPAVGDLVPVLSGLEEGELVVVAGTFLLKAELGKGSSGAED